MGLREELRLLKVTCDQNPLFWFLRVWRGRVVSIFCHQVRTKWLATGKIL